MPDPEELRRRARAELARRELARRRSLANPVQPAADQQQSPEGQRVGMGAGLVRSALQGVTFGFADELAGSLAGAAALVPGGRSPREAYTQERDRVRESHEQFQEQSPRASLAAEIVPAFATGGAGAAKIALGGSKLGRAAASGAASAGLYGAGSAEGGVGRRIARGAVSAAAGAATGGVLRGAGRVVRRAPKVDAPSTEALRKEGSALFEAAKDAGEEVGGKKFVKFMKSLTDDLSGEGVDKVLHPKVHRALGNASALASDLKYKVAKKVKFSPVEFQKLITTRRQLALAGRSLEPDERRIASKAVTALDDFVENSTKEAGVLTAKGRKVWARMRKADLIEETIEKAQSRASGKEAGLRNEFSKLYRNKKLMRGFSKEEKAAIKAVSDGTPTANVLRIIGGLSIGEGQRRNVLAALGGILAGGAVGGGAGAIAAPIVGMGAQRLAQRGTMKRAQLARALAAAGKPAAKAQSGIAETLARRSAVPAAVLVNR